MAGNIIYQPGYNLRVVCTSPTTPASGDPVRFHGLTGIALTDEGDGGSVSTETTIYIGPGIFDLTVDDNESTAIAVGDPIFYHDTGTGTGSVHLNNTEAGGYFFGYALEVVADDATTEIQVMHPAPSASRSADHGIKVALIDGGAAGDHTVTGIAVGDELIFVGMFATKASIATLADQTAEHSVSAADTINNTGGTSSASNQLFIIYRDLT